MSLHEQKSLLAKLMATEDIRIVQQHTDTASFNVKTRVLTVPILKNTLSKDVYDLFMGHEVGHARFTPLEGLEKASKLGINMSVANVVEDSRIERKIKDKYPGLKAPFIRAYKELYDDDFFGTDGRSINDYKFIDRVNLHCKVGSSLNIKFSDEELELLKEIESTQTYDDVIEVCKKLKGHAQDEMLTTKKVLVQVERGDMSDDDLEKIELTPEEMQELEVDAETDVSFKNKTQNLYNKDASVVYKYGDIPSFDIKNRIFDFKDFYKEYEHDGFKFDTASYLTFKKESAKVVAYLVKEFEMRKNADQMKRAAVAKTGELDMNRVYSYKFADDLFKKATIVPGGKSHGLVMFLDWSGSMTRYLTPTIKQLLNLTMFCKMVNIPFEVYCFLDSTKSKYMNMTQVRHGIISHRNFALINLLSNRMTAKEYTDASSALLMISDSRYKRPSWMQMSGTPLNEAILMAMDIVPSFQKKNRVQVVNTVFLTDGEGEDLVGVGEGARNDVRYSHLVIRDPVTKNEEVYAKGSNGIMGMTPHLITLLRKRTNAHVVGMFICGEDQLSYRKDLFPKNEDSAAWSAVLDEFRKERAIISTQKGFSEYYVINSAGMVINNDELEIRQNSTVKSMVTQFTKYASNKISARVVLKRFINLIS